MKQPKLTNSEKNLMEVLWRMKTAFMKDILEMLPEPKPASSTVATLLKRMQNKKLVGYKTFGNSREYFALVKKEDYFHEEMSTIIDRFFGSSVTQFASFFTSNAKLSQKELKELRNMIDEQIND